MTLTNLLFFLLGAAVIAGVRLTVLRVAEGRARFWRKLYEREATLRARERTEQEERETAAEEENARTPDSVLLRRRPFRARPIRLSPPEFATKAQQARAANGAPEDTER